MEYHLYPPFFVVPEESNFSDAWEVFCCKLLNLKEQTDEIYRRHPPEQGIDLYHPVRNTAYQCKSVESGKSGDFNVSKAIESIKAAKLVKSKIKWKKYVLCTNVDITGTAEDKLRGELSNIVLRPKSFWQAMCEQNGEYVQRNFRVLINISNQKVSETIDRDFYEHYSKALKATLSRQSFEIYLFSNRHDKIYKMPVSSSFKIKDLLHILKCFFKLPMPRVIEAEGVSVSLSHSVVFEGKQQYFSKSLDEMGITAGSIVTYWTQILWDEVDAKFDADVFNMIKLGSHEGHDPVKRVERALKVYNEAIHEAFKKFDTEVVG